MTDGEEKIYDDELPDGILGGEPLTASGKDGEKLVYAGNNLWVPESCVMSEEEKREYAARFSHPVINKKAVALQLLLPPLITGIIVTVFGLIAGRYFVWAGNPLLLFAVSGGLLLAYSLFRLKSIIIFAVQLYQIKAPMSVRERCALVPTCSDYMILAVRKYGALRGLIKGIKRLKRCDGTPGEDWP